MEPLELAHVRQDVDIEIVVGRKRRHWTSWHLKKRSRQKSLPNLLVFLMTEQIRGQAAEEPSMVVEVMPPITPAKRARAAVDTPPKGPAVFRRMRRKTAGNAAACFQAS